MNSYSKFDGDYEPCKKEKKVDNNMTYIKCGAPGAISLPAVTVVGTTFTPASLTLNTTSICNPCVKLEVTSNIIATAFTGALTFQILKQCRNQFAPVPIGPAFTFSEAAAVTNASTFTFFVCDCDSCDNNCCTYTLLISVAVVTAGVLAINNATIGAIVSSPPSLCCNN